MNTIKSSRRLIPILIFTLLASLAAARNVSATVLPLASGNSIQGFAQRQGMPVDRQSCTTISLNGNITTHSASAGVFTFENISAGSYTLRAAYPGFLPAQKSISVLETDPAIWNAGSTTLTGGDVNGDLAINILDITPVIQKFGSVNPAVGSSSPNCSVTDDPADINDDAAINISDLAIAAGNWGRTGPTEWTSTSQPTSTPTAIPPTATATPPPNEIGTLTVNPQNRQESLNFFLQNYLPYDPPPINWTGDRNSCSSGTTDPNFQIAVLRRVNYFRAMAGVPAGVTFSSEANGLAQAAALMMSVNNNLDHTPPDTWLCYSADGYEGASSSNLSLGVNGPDAITGYMADPGGGNYFVGHRRWLLYPQTQEMGTGDVPASTNNYESNSLHVFDAHMWDARPATREEFVAWPPPGFVPWDVVFPRWSFSYSHADFSSAVVSMTSNGSSLPISLSPLETGYGENTLVWIPLGLSDWDPWPFPAVDTSYNVLIQNVIVDGSSRDFSYTVTVFDPLP